jgi:hypothetical protein
VIEFTPEGKLVRMLPDIPDTARICNLARADDFFVMNALAPIEHTPGKTAPIYAHSGERLLSTIEPGQLGIPVLKHLHHVWPHYITGIIPILYYSGTHHVWPHYITGPDGERTLYILISGWSEGKFAVLKHEPAGLSSPPCGWSRSPVDGSLSATSGVKW